MTLCSSTNRTHGRLVACLLGSVVFLAGCRSLSEPSVAELIEAEQKRAERILTLPPADRRAELHRVLDQAKSENDGIHDACLLLDDVGDMSSVPHIIRVLRFFGDAELPLPLGVGIVCTQ